MHFSFLKKCQHALGDSSWRIVRDDVFRFLKRCNSSYGLVFADPPYALKELGSIPDLVLESGLLNENGIFVFEHGKDYCFKEHPHFMRHIAYGSVNFTFFSKEKNIQQEEH